MSEPVRDPAWIPLVGSLRVGIQQTLRVPTTGGPYPLPPALGRLPVHAASALARHSESLAKDADVVVPLHRHEAMWLQFNARLPDVFAVKIAVGAVDALTGRAWNVSLDDSPQNYIVCPYQPWLDGFKSGAGVVRQFVAVPIGSGASVEQQLTGRDEGGLTLAAFAAKTPGSLGAVRREGQPHRRDLGVGAGGEIRQRIYPDPYGVDTWETAPSVVVRLRLIDATEYATLTGEAVPPSAIDAATYSRFGLPWFEIFDADRGDVPTPPALSGIEPASSPSEGAGGGSDAPVTPQVVRPIPPRSIDHD